MTCTLYYANGVASLAPQILLDLSNINYTPMRLSLAKAEHKTAAYSAINPYQTVPSFITEDKQTLSETLAIMLYICAHYKLAYMPSPSNPQYYNYLTKLLFLNNTIQPTYRVWYFAHQYSTHANHIDAVKESFLPLQFGHWQHVNDHFFSPHQTSPYMMGGDTISIADMMAFMLIWWYPNFTDNLLHKLPNIKNCFEACMAIPSIQATLKNNRMV